MSKSRYKRILLKLTGEAISGEAGFGINFDVMEKIALEIKDVHDMGIEIGMVIGGGNIFRGSIAEKAGMDRVTADYMGMLATVINGMALQDAMERNGVVTRMLTSIDLRQVAEPFVRRRAIRHLEKKRVVIFAAGTGNPYFTTDTAAALRAIEIGADVILKATKVDGIYSDDPKKVDNAEKYDALTYLDIIKRDLKVMDTTAITLCRDNKIPIVVFNLMKSGNIKKVLTDSSIGTTVCN